MSRVFIVSLLLILTSAAAIADADPMAAVQADFAAGQYRPCLQKIAAALADPVAKPNAPQRYDLFMLRGESLLQLKEASLAASAFDAAARAAKGDPDLHCVAAAKGSLLLIKASMNLKYKPGRGSESGPIDIVAPDSRKQAMMALLQDRLSTLMPRVDQAMQSTTLLPLHQLLPDLSNALMIEIAATGDAQQTLPIAKSMGEHARQLITDQLNTFAKRANELYDQATEPAGFGNSIGIRGLTSPERDELHAMAEEIMKIQQLAQQGGRANRRLGGNGEAWDTILANCDDVADRVQQAYDKKY